MELSNIENKKIYILKNWEITSSIKYKDIKYKAPECLLLSLQGIIYNHPIFKDESFITTSNIVNVTGRYIETRNGSIYKLEGEPSEGYKQYCKEKKIDIDIKNPINLL